MKTFANVSDLQLCEAQKFAYIFVGLQYNILKWQNAVEEKTVASELTVRN